MESIATSLGFEISLHSKGVPIIPIPSEHPRLDDALAGGPLLPVSADGAEMGSAVASTAGPDTMAELAVGVEFESPDAARAFYSAYAGRTGFRVRNSKSFTSRVDDNVIMRRFVSSRQGQPTKKDPFDSTKKRRNRASSREGCKAMETGRGAVTRCLLEHCHSLGVQSKRSPALQKKLSKKPWELLACNNAASEPTQHCNGLGPGGGVAQSLLKYFKRMQGENPAFLYAIQVDNNNCLTNVFWADARARIAYSYFGDAVVLDMTCKRNRHVVLLFAAFTGMNHHQQLIVLGCGFMTDESEASFAWLFETWLMLMSGRRPVSLVAVQSDAIAIAAARAFPNVQHRFCKRDILNKCKEKLSNIYSAHPLFKSEFKKCVNESESIDEFDASWRSLVRRFYLENNMWL